MSRALFAEKRTPNPRAAPTRGARRSWVTAPPPRCRTSKPSQRLTGRLRTRLRHRQARASVFLIARCTLTGYASCNWPESSTMTDENIGNGLQLRSLIKKSGELELSLRMSRRPNRRPMKSWFASRRRRSIPPTSDCFWARPICPRRAVGNEERPVVTAKIPEALMRAMAGRLDESMPVGNEGAGVVVNAGASDAAQCAARQDRRGDRRRHVRAISLHQGRRLPCAAGTARRRRKAHRASSIRSLRWAWSRRCGAKATRRWCTRRRPPTLGRCSTRSASRTAIGLVNIVRTAQQEDILREIGATHVAIPPRRRSWRT